MDKYAQAQQIARTVLALTHLDNTQNRRNAGWTTTRFMRDSALKLMKVEPGREALLMMHLSHLRAWVVDAIASSYNKERA